MPATVSASSSTRSASSTRRSYSPAASSSSNISNTTTTTAPNTNATTIPSWNNKDDIYHPQGPLPPSKPNHAFTKRPEKGSSFVTVLLWRWRLWFEATFVLSMLEPWEKLMLTTIFVIIWMFFISALYKYLPHHVIVMQRRAMYYLVGQEGDERLFRQWLGGLMQGQGSGAEALKEL